MSCRAAPDCARPPGPHPGARRPAHLRVRHGLGRLTGPGRPGRPGRRCASPGRYGPPNITISLLPRPRSAREPLQCRARPGPRAALDALPGGLPRRGPPRSACRPGRPARSAAAPRPAPVRVPPWTPCPVGCRAAARPGPGAALVRVPSWTPCPAGCRGGRASVQSRSVACFYVVTGGAKSPGSSVPSCVKRRDFRVVSDHNAFWNRPKAVPSRNPTRGAFIV